MEAKLQTRIDSLTKANAMEPVSIAVFYAVQHREISYLLDQPMKKVTTAEYNDDRRPDMALISLLQAEG